MCNSIVDTTQSRLSVVDLVLIGSKIYVHFVQIKNL